MTRVSNQLISAAPSQTAPQIAKACGRPRAGLAARFAEDKRGSTAIMFALLITPVMMLTGMAVDFSRMVTVKSRMQTVLDAAALAGGKAAQLNPTTIAVSAQTAAQGYFNAMPTPFVESKSLSAVTADLGQTQFTWTSTSWIKTPFLSVAAMITNKPAAADAPPGCAGGWWVCQKVVTTASSLLSSGGSNTGYSIETSFMLDITGSMQGQKLTDLKAAAHDAVDILIWADQSSYTSRVAISPFAQDVRLPTSAAFQAATGQVQVSTTKIVNGDTYATKSTELCVVERIGGQRYTDVAPAAGAYSMIDWTQTNNPNNAHCNVPASAAVQPLTADKTVLHNLVNGLQTAGGTAGHIGTAWAWYMLSPNWNSLWSNTNAAKPYDTAYNINTHNGVAQNVKLKKIVVLMTDGDYNTEYTSQGINTDTYGQAPANDWSQTQAAALCTAMKKDGINIEVYSVIFTEPDIWGGTPSQGARNFMKSCGTDASHYYEATDGNSLKMAFRDIALKISSLRMSH